MVFAARELVSSPSGEHFLVAGSPKGGLKKHATTAGIATWVTPAPGIVGILGLLINKVFFRGRWVVTVEPVGLDGTVQHPSWSRSVPSLEEANALVPGLAARLRNGTRLPPDPDAA